MERKWSAHSWAIVLSLSLIRERAKHHRATTPLSKATEAMKAVEWLVCALCNRAMLPLLKMLEYD
jgi:hypothetical protein